MLNAVRTKLFPRSFSVILFLSLFLSGCPQSADSNTQSAAQNNSSETQETAATETQTNAVATHEEGKGVGPVTQLELAALDPELAKKGQEIFDSKCSSCHKLEAKYVGPALQGITERRQPEWIMNMILNPEGMIKEDPEAKALFAKFMMQMPNQNMDEASARAILEYFRSVESH